MEKAIEFLVVQQRGDGLLHGMPVQRIAQTVGKTHRALAAQFVACGPRCQARVEERRFVADALRRSVQAPMQAGECAHHGRDPPHAGQGG
jgi:hypothetical protein